MSSLCYPVSRPVRAAEPTLQQEPVTLAEVKRQCSVADDINEHNEVLSSILVAARQQVESDTGLVCYTGTYSWKFTEFPCRDWFELPDVRPITSITSIVYVASDGTSTTWSSSYYSLETSGVTQFVRLTYGNVWPTLRGDINGVTVTFVCGYSSGSAPALLKQAVLLQSHIRWLQMNNEDTSKREQSYGWLIKPLMRGVYP